MSSSPSPSPRRPGPFSNLLAWGVRRLGRSRGSLLTSAQSGASDPLLEVGRSLREAREARGLTLRQLALDTRISTAVLESLEKGWRDRLPEPTYLRGMLNLLEQHLGLSGGSLQVVLPPRVAQAGSSLADSRQRRFSPTSIELFTTWQGCLLYGLLCLGLIYGLNRQQQQLASRGLLTLRPLPPLPAASDRSEAGSTTALPQRVLAAYPDVRPLERASRGQGLALLRKDLRQSPAPAAGKDSGARSRTLPAEAVAPGSGTASGAAPGSGVPGVNPEPDQDPTQPAGTRP